MPKKDSEKSQAEKDAGTEVPVPEQEHSGATSEPIADFDKHTAGVEKEDPAQPSDDEPHGHPFQPDSAEPVLVTEGAGRGQMTKAQRKGEELVKISPEEAYDDPEFNPVAAAGISGHNGGPGAPDGEGTERAVAASEAVDQSHDEQAENLDYDWKSEGGKN